MGLQSTTKVLGLAAFQTCKRVGSWLSWIVGKEHGYSWGAKSQGSLLCKARVRDWNRKDRIISFYLAWDCVGCYRLVRDELEDAEELVDYR